MLHCGTCCRNSDRDKGVRRGTGSSRRAWECTRLPWGVGKAGGREKSLARLECRVQAGCLGEKAGRGQVVGARNTVTAQRTRLAFAVDLPYPSGGGGQLSAR